MTHFGASLVFSLNSWRWGHAKFVKVLSNHEGFDSTSSASAFEASLHTHSQTTQHSWVVAVCHFVKHFLYHNAWNTIFFVIFIISLILEKSNTVENISSSLQASSCYIQRHGSRTYRFVGFRHAFLFRTTILCRTFSFLGFCTICQQYIFRMFLFPWSFATSILLCHIVHVFYMIYYCYFFPWGRLRKHFAVLRTHARDVDAFCFPFLRMKCLRCSCYF